jgi:sugar/nucleoside kinase (ribokinase family)
MSSARPEILCLGLVVADVIARPLSRLPAPGRLETCRHISLHPGGCAVNTGSALAKLGLKTGLIGATGDDGFAAFLRGSLRERGLDLRGLKIFKKAPTSASIVAVNAKGERSFTHLPGANALLSARDADGKLLQAAKILHVGGSFLMPRLDGKPLAALLKRARGRGIKTSLDTVYNPRLNWARILKPCLPHLDYFLPSFEEARQIAGTPRPEGMAKKFQGLGARVVAIKMGEKGAFLHDGRKGIQIKAPKIRAVDSTGAGDAFCAGFLAGVRKGFSLTDCVKLGNTLGASCCLGVGAYDALPGAKVALARMKTWYKGRA